MVKSCGFHQPSRLYTVVLDKSTVDKQRRLQMYLEGSCPFLDWSRSRVDCVYVDLEGDFCLRSGESLQLICLSLSFVFKKPSLKNLVGPLRLTMSEVSNDLNNLVRTLRWAIYLPSSLFTHSRHLNYAVKRICLANHQWNVNLFHTEDAISNVCNYKTWKFSSLTVLCCQERLYLLV